MRRSGITGRRRPPDNLQSEENESQNCICCCCWWWWWWFPVQLTCNHGSCCFSYYSFSQITLMQCLLNSSYCKYDKTLFADCKYAFLPIINSNCTVINTQKLLFGPKKRLCRILISTPWTHRIVKVSLD